VGKRTAPQNKRAAVETAFLFCAAILMCQNCYADFYYETKKLNSKARAGKAK
jgi:hypothetical protein